MSHAPSSIDPDLLLAQTRFVRRLAGALLADENAVDDVVQQTLVTALEHPPRSGRSR